ncbi:hypothetical protein NAEGRDRAFT_71975 [Naegleria gruberi]|uniref:Uncharacterized protein n=1 Tax=Naegleria gruberi TaxID=5762 RepID=D2VSK8_NAEGR|nr:uncharacterized protein NAEGRDRAFT_71975 [Naegleria gruberi]EFC40209.1 hypothetical protein NAEGRDRAFT_71975 [Naegleria gruberi]|eukprot:XP_002672953.1 hypothetical protein NAEGRDRAFT_71975 [Naegleria gruberi strain NEG-M]
MRLFIPNSTQNKYHNTSTTLTMNNHETVLCEGTLDMFDAPSFTSINISSNSSSSPSSNSPSLVFHLSTSSDFQTSEQTKQSSSGKRSKSKAKKRKVILDEDDERDYEECDFILEKGVYSYAPKYQCWTDISSEVKQVYRVVWDMFAKCARSIINDHLEMRNTSRVHHLTLGSCLPTVFYLILKETNGVFNQWFQVVKKHGIKVKEECIQFRFKNCLPCLDKYDDWGNFQVKLINNTCKFGQKVLLHRMKINYISLPSV